MKFNLTRIAALLLCVLLLVGCTAEPPVESETETETVTPVEPEPLVAQPVESVYLPVENGDFEVLIGASAKDIRLTGKIQINLPCYEQVSSHYISR